MTGEPRRRPKPVDASLVSRVLRDDARGFASAATRERIRAAAQRPDHDSCSARSWSRTAPHRSALLVLQHGLHADGGIGAEFPPSRGGSWCTDGPWSGRRRGQRRGSRGREPCFSAGGSRRTGTCRDDQLFERPGRNPRSSAPTAPRSSPSRRFRTRYGGNCSRGTCPWWSSSPTGSSRGTGRAPRLRRIRSSAGRWKREPERRNGSPRSSNARSRRSDRGRATRSVPTRTCWWHWAGCCRAGPWMRCWPGASACRAARRTDFLRVSPSGTVRRTGSPERRAVHPQRHHRPARGVRCGHS